MGKGAWVEDQVARRHSERFGAHTRAALAARSSVGNVAGMLTAIRTDWDVKVPAWTVDRTAGPFTCPECRAEVTLRRGSKRVHHVAHRPDTACGFGAGETEAHRACKQALYEGLLALTEAPARATASDRGGEPCVTFAALDHPVGRQRADVYAEIAGVRVALEVQASALAPEELARRTAGYARAGVAVCWLHPFEPDGIGSGLGSGRHSPTQWETWVHAANGGRSYYWWYGLLVQPVHFGPFHREVEERRWTDRGGWTRHAGGYTKVLKLARTPVPGRLAHLVRDFGATHRGASTRDGLRVPSCTVYRDRQPDWWPADARGGSGSAPGAGTGDPNGGAAGRHTEPSWRRGRTADDIAEEGRAGRILKF